MECTIPILPVVDLQRSADFYLGRMGFQLDWGNPETDVICSVSRDSCPIMLRKVADGEKCMPPVWVWIGVEHDGVFEEWRAAGVEVIQESRNFTWAWEMKFLDPDGNTLWVGTEPKTDRPFEDTDEGEAS